MMRLKSKALGLLFCLFIVTTLRPSVLVSASGNTSTPVGVIPPEYAMYGYGDPNHSDYGSEAGQLYTKLTDSAKFTHSKTGTQDPAYQVYVSQNTHITRASSIFAYITQDPVVSIQTSATTNPQDYVAYDTSVGKFVSRWAIDGFNIKISAIDGKGNQVKVDQEGQSSDWLLEGASWEYSSLATTAEADFSYGNQPAKRDSSDNPETNTVMIGLIQKGVEKLASSAIPYYSDVQPGINLLLDHICEQKTDVPTVSASYPDQFTMEIKVDPGKTMNTDGDFAVNSMNFVPSIRIVQPSGSGHMQIKVETNVRLALVKASKISSAYWSQFVDSNIYKFVPTVTKYQYIGSSTGSSSFRIIEPTADSTSHGSVSITTAMDARKLVAPNGDSMSLSQSAPWVSLFGPRASVTLTPNRKTGYTFSHWEDANGNTIVSSNDAYNSISVNSNGVMTISGTQAFQYGSGGAQLLLFKLKAVFINSLPIVSITSPSNGATVSGTITVYATASSVVGITKVVFYISGSRFATDYSSSYRGSLDTTVYPNGWYTIMVKAYNSYGESSYKTKVVYISNQNASPPPICKGCSAW